jgi:DNA-binding MarR family transcriptional regulator
MSPQSVTVDDYRRLLELRTGLRRFLTWSADRAREAGLTPGQHQLLLAVRGDPDPLGPTIATVAEYLQTRHHSTVELIDRAERDGLVRRRPDPHDARIVRIRTTRKGDARLNALSKQHLEELERLAPRMASLWVGLD